MSLRLRGTSLLASLSLEWENQKINKNIWNGWKAKLERNIVWPHGYLISPRGQNISPIWNFAKFCLERLESSLDWDPTTVQIDTNILRGKNHYIYIFLGFEVKKILKYFKKKKSYTLKMYTFSLKAFWLKSRDQTNGTSVKWVSPTS